MNTSVTPLNTRENQLPFLENHRLNKTSNFSEGSSGGFAPRGMLSIPTVPVRAQVHNTDDTRDFGLSDLTHNDWTGRSYAPMAPVFSYEGVSDELGIQERLIVPSAPVIPEIGFNLAQIDLISQLRSSPTPSANNTNSIRTSRSDANKAEQMPPAYKDLFPLEN